MCKLIPGRYFDSLPEGQTKDSPLAKTLKGAIAYLKDTGHSSANGKSQANASKDFRPLRSRTPPWLRNRTELRALQQTMTMLTQVIQSRAIEQGALSEELKKSIGEENDALIDIM
ncbi:uncharacterized protein PV07_02422 [Cladophialophora immunda]|uniref:Uncharacterized protein n=1 Tax=Cladophialophora immunda TaxID=569365 RepID=A0A0D1ZRN7_9EURO|nr:uncharacterized protein PV07_02422 [Cladophialophora immunda]KIW30716.1 hypothetical protein PV07_02422 [Cladophialophora immunda]